MIAVIYLSIVGKKEQCMKRIPGFILPIVFLAYSICAGSPIIISSIPDTFSVTSASRTPVKFLSLDTALYFKGLFTTSNPGHGTQDFELKKLPADSAHALVESTHPVTCPSPLVPCLTYSIHNKGIQYAIQSSGRTFYLKPVNVYIDSQTALMDSVRFFVDSVSFLARVPVLPKPPLTNGTAIQKHAVPKVIDVFGRQIPRRKLTPGVYLVGSVRKSGKALYVKTVDVGD